MPTEKQLIYLQDAIAVLEKDVADSKDALKTAYYGDKVEIQAEMNGVRAAIHLLKHHASHGGTVDAVEVVRCKDCEHCHNGWCNHFGYYSYAPKVDDDDFCSYGERRKGE